MKSADLRTPSYASGRTGYGVQQPRILGVSIPDGMVDSPMDVTEQVNEERPLAEPKIRSAM